LHVTTVGRLVINLGRGYLLAHLLAINAPRVLHEEALPGLVPLAVVPALVPVAALAVVLAPLAGLSSFALTSMRLAITSLTTSPGAHVFDELGAPWLGADAAHQEHPPMIAR
jgi:hypothetical protein